MIRTLLWLIGGAMLGGIIHIMVILSLPQLAENTAWARVNALNARNTMQVQPKLAPGAPNPLHLDPEIITGICQVDLDDGPAFVQGVLPEAFWSVAVYNSDGIVTYSTTNRDGIGQTVELGLFNAPQTRLLAQQEIDIPDSLLVVEASSNDLFVVVRLAPPHAVMRPRFEAAMAALRCGPQP